MEGVGAVALLKGLTTDMRRILTKRFRIGILLSILVLVMAGYLAMHYVHAKEITLADIITIVGLIIALLWAILTYFQNEEELNISAQALEEQRQARFDAMSDSVMEKIIEAHNHKNSRVHVGESE